VEGLAFVGGVSLVLLVGLVFVFRSRRRDATRLLFSSESDGAAGIGEHAYYPPIASIHEAGHALLYSCLDSVPHDLRVSIKRDLLSHGLTTGTLIREAVDSEWMKWEMLLCLAGREAERSIFHVTTPGCITDFRRWQDLARIYLSAGMGGLYFVRPSSDWECQRNEKAIAELLAEHEHLLQHFFKTNKALLHELASELRQQEVLGREVLLGYLKQVNSPNDMPRPRMVVTLNNLPTCPRPA